MHPPGDLQTREAVPENEVIMRLMTGWLHADPPAAPATEPDQLDKAAVKALKRGGRK